MVMMSLKPTILNLTISIDRKSFKKNLHSKIGKTQGNYSASLSQDG